MVGLNDELSRELLGRIPGRPDRHLLPELLYAATPDIGPIRGFDANGALGTHVANATSGTQFVLLIRATPFQRYPNAMGYAAQCNGRAECGRSPTSFSTLSFAEISART